MDGTIITKKNNYVKMMYLKSSKIGLKKLRRFSKRLISTALVKIITKILYIAVNKLVESGSHQSYYEQAFATLIENNSFPLKVINLIMMHGID